MTLAERANERNEEPRANDVERESRLGIAGLPYEDVTMRLDVLQPLSANKENGNGQTRQPAKASDTHQPTKLDRLGR